MCASPFRGMPITVFIGVPTAIKVFSWSTPIDGYGGPEDQVHALRGVEVQQVVPPHDDVVVV